MYLSHIQISNFRTYGPEFEIRIPARAGLTILCGMNGLGKTAFFDAVEWALTGQVQRLGEKVKANVIARHGSPPNSQRVRLSWENQSIERGATTGTSLSDIVNLLKDDSWATPITDPIPYLRLTHFLPQSSGTRFLHQAKDQWGMLKGPAGIDRLEAYRLLLDDRKARNAFNAKIARIGGEKTIAGQKLTHWKDLLQQKSNLQHLADLTMPVASEDIPPRINEVARSLSQPPEEDLQSFEINDSAEKLKSLRRVADEWIRAINEWESKIPAATDALGRTTVAKVELEELTGRIARQAHLLEAANNSIANDTEALRLAALNHKATKDRMDSFESIVRSLSRIIEADELRQTKTEELKAIDLKIAGLLEEKKAIDLSRERLVSLVAEHKKIADASVSASNQEQAIAQRLKLYTSAFELRQRALQQAFSKKQFATKKEAAESLLATEQPKLVAAHVRLENLQGRLRTAQQIGDEIAKAVAVIAANLKEDDTVCPVCNQGHQPGYLAKTAALAVSKAGTESEEILKDLETVKVAIKQLQDSIDAQKVVLGETTQKIAALEKDEQAASSAFAPFEAEAIGLNIDPTQFGDTLNRQLADSLKRKEDLIISLSGLESAANLNGKIEKTVRELNEAEEKILALKESSNRVKSDIERAEAILRAQATTSTQSSDLQDLISRRTQAVADRAALEVPLQDAAAAVSKAEDRLKEGHQKAEALHVEKRQMDRSALDVRQKLDAAFDHWKALGLPGEPSEAGLIHKQQDILDQRARATVAAQQIDSIGEAVDICSKKGLLLKADQAIQKFLSESRVNSPAECTELLNGELQKAEDDERRITEVSERAAAIASGLTSMSKGFSERALTPLNRRITEFNKLISPFPYTYNIKARITDTSAKTTSMIGVPSLMKDEVIDRDIDTWLSEGQTSALGLSVLFGASTVYRWSKWRALLLDDPLQNTDLIHAAAFADVIRGLIKDEGYQVLLSTHSMEEADFLHRKCRSADIPVGKVSLLSLGPSGVRYRTDFDDV
jgi:DNA repair exonuclease SbcCD ATPase subunit